MLLSVSCIKQDASIFQDAYQIFTFNFLQFMSKFTLGPLGPFRSWLRRLIVRGVSSNLKVVEVLQFLILFIVEFKQLFNEVTVVSIDGLTVFLEVQDGSWLWFKFIDVEIVHTSNLMRRCSVRVVFKGA